MGAPKENLSTSSKGETESKGTEPLGPKGRTELFELRNLAVGKAAPEIEGEDVDGVKFKLSDYRGKVVLLDFWSFV